MIVVNGTVMDLSPFVSQFQLFTGNSTADKDVLVNSLRPLLDRKSPRKGVKSIPDATRLLSQSKLLISFVPCMTNAFKVGWISKDPPSCFVYNCLNYFLLFLILLIIGCKFGMALLFSWCVAPALAAKPSSSKKRLTLPGIVPSPPCYHPHGSPIESAGISDSKADTAQDPYVVMLVTAYSEGLDALQLTLDSMAETTYSCEHKCFMIIADGIVTGGGNKESTPDIILSMLDLDPTWKDPKPFDYKAVAGGSLQHNMAKVYVGHYGEGPFLSLVPTFLTCLWIESKSSRVPAILVVKCGTPKEQGNAKPGNRGKRDSQIILMNFFSRVLLNERMYPLEFDLFRKLHYLMGVTPDCFEAVLMVSILIVSLPTTRTTDIPR
jgi:chitin synthase